MKAGQNLFFICVIPLFLLSCGTTESTVEISRKVEAQLTSGNYKIIPGKLGQVTLQSGFYITVSKDSVFIFLPRPSGIEHYPTYVDLLEIYESTGNYSISPNRKNDGWNIFFRTRSFSHLYEIDMQVWNNGKSSFTINKSTPYIGNLELSNENQIKTY